MEFDCGLSSAERRVCGVVLKRRSGTGDYSAAFLRAGAVDFFFVAFFFATVCFAAACFFWAVLVSVPGAWRC